MDNLLSWTHYFILIGVFDQDARLWYEKECKSQNWSVRTLKRNVSSQYYYRLLKTNELTKAEREEPLTYEQNKLEFIKNPVIFEFLGIPQDEKIHESELESLIITNLRDTLLELGKGYAFIGRQYHIHTEKKDYFILGLAAGSLMGVGAGIASLFIAPVLVGQSVAIGAATISSGAALAIGTGIAFGSGAIIGGTADMFAQIINAGKISDWASVVESAIQWGVLNVFSAFAGSIGGPLSNLETILITAIFNGAIGAVGLLIDVIRNRKKHQSQIQEFAILYGYGS